MTITDVVAKVLDSATEGKEQRLKSYKNDIHRMTNQLQVVLGNMEMGEHEKALASLQEHITLVHAVATRLAAQKDVTDTPSPEAQASKKIKKTVTPRKPPHSVR